MFASVSASVAPGGRARQAVRYRGVFRVGSESYCQHRQGQGSPSASCSSPCCRGFGSFASQRISFERNPPRHGSRPMAAGSNRERVRTVVLALLGLLFFATAIGAVVDSILHAPRCTAGPMLNAVL